MTNYNTLLSYSYSQIDVPPSNRVAFGDCMIGVAKKVNFTISNHSECEIVRFNWDPVPNLTFSPMCGHLQPKCAKDVTVTYYSTTPHKLDKLNIPCKVSTIMFGQDGKKVRTYF